jgi:hypothetical protein
MQLRVLRGRGRQAALPPPKPVEQRLPPAEIEKREQLPAHTEYAAPEPEEDVHLSQAGTIPPPGREPAVRKNLQGLCLVDGEYLTAGKRIFGNGTRNLKHRETAPNPIHSAVRSTNDLVYDHDFPLYSLSLLFDIKHPTHPFPLIIEDEHYDHLIKKSQWRKDNEKD